MNDGVVGAKVLWLLPGGAAERAGLRVGDKVNINILNAIVCRTLTICTGANASVSSDTLSR